MLRLVGPPFEVVVPHLILHEVRDVGGLGRDRLRDEQEGGRDRHDWEQVAAASAVAHIRSPCRMTLRVPAREPAGTGGRVAILLPTLNRRNDAMGAPGAKDIPTRTCDSCGKSRRPRS